MLTTITDNLKDFSGTGLLVVLLAVVLVFLALWLEKGPKKVAMVWMPIFILVVYFCPVWYFYINKRDDSEILYRVLWMIPFSVITCYAFVEAIFALPKKKRTYGFAAAVLLIILSGQYLYTNPQFKRAENIYHVPQTVVDICDALKVDGREIKVCMPLEYVQYTRQYCPNICQTYGRAVLMGYMVDITTDISDYLEKDIVDVKYVSSELKRTMTHYLVISEMKELSEPLENYNYSLVEKMDGYDIYLDNDMYLGTDFDNFQ